MVAKFSNYGGSKVWASQSSINNNWKNTLPFGDCTNMDINNNAKSLAWGFLIGNDFLFKTSYPEDSNKYLKTVNNCIENNTLSNFFSVGLWASFPNLSVDSYIKKCDIYKTHANTPHWLVQDSNWANYGPSQQSPFIIFGRTDVSDTTAVISGFIPSVTEADVGLGTSEVGDWDYVNVGPGNYGSLGGSPWSETVFMFIK